MQDEPGPDGVARAASDRSDPLRALSAVVALRRLADQLEHQQVEQERAEGADAAAAHRRIQLGHP